MSAREIAALKLTQAQRELLELAAQGELAISYNHPIAAELSDIGLMALGPHITDSIQILFSRSAKITPGGRAALQEQEEKADV